MKTPFDVMCITQDLPLIEMHSAGNDNDIDSLTKVVFFWPPSFYYAHLINRNVGLLLWIKAVLDKQNKTVGLINSVGKMGIMTFKGKNDCKQPFVWQKMFFNASTLFLVFCIFYIHPPRDYGIFPHPLQDRLGHSWLQLRSFSLYLNVSFYKGGLHVNCPVEF